MRKTLKPFKSPTKPTRDEPTKGARLVALLRGRGTVKLTTRQIMDMTRRR